jgi:hypothetical protein
MSEGITTARKDFSFIGIKLVSLWKNSMITTDEFAQNLANYFVNATYKEHAINHIIIEINSVHYRVSKQPLQFNIKAAIVQLIEIKIANDARCLNVFQQLKPTLLKKLRQHDNYKAKDAKMSTLASYAKKFEWESIFNYRS